ncbi:hypothetical protein NHX12_000824 [Muraenolepis orangiensis]|uniref:Uncharacterized protein n=1 Tax=Muraenolepis orangiensis TaxID=630683 RepID=A0A9Q0IHK9_9TELE|nr:hypothetical protein NHX12_000824 [Muraenolepis orangiensis]
MGEIIKEEISKAPSDVSNAAQLSFVLRFELKERLKERFVKFEDVAGKKRTEDVAALALGFLEEHGCMDKLVAQCYDTAAVMASGLNGDRSALALAKLQQDAFLDIVTEDEKTKEARREDMITKMINILQLGYHTQHGNDDICAGPQRTGFGLTGLCGVIEGPGPMVLLDHQNYA